MKVAVDARMINASGIGICIKNWTKNGCYDIALGKLEELQNYKFDNVISFQSKIYGIKEQLKFPYKELKKLKPDVLHIPHYNVPIFYRGKMVVTIHDLTHLIFPEFLPNKLAKYYAKFIIKIATKKASKILTISENTKKDIIKFFNVNPEKIEVVYIGVGDEFRIKNKEEIEYLYSKFNIPKDKKILMYVGNMKLHKNLNRLLEAFNLIENKEDYRLLLVGKSFKSQLDLEKIEEQLNIKEYVIHTGMVEQEELVDLYNLANLFVFPSLYEGFGLPPLEAMACGTNVIASNVSSIPEVCEDVIEYFDPYDIVDIRNKIVENVDKNLNDEAKELLKKYNWESGTKRIKEVMEEV